jgi:hypothetical protein
MFENPLTSKTNNVRLFGHYQEINEILLSYPKYFKPAGFIYAFLLNQSNLKIGYSSDINQRLKQHNHNLKIYNKAALRDVLIAGPFLNGPVVESKIKEKFPKEHIDFELFNLSFHQLFNFFSTNKLSKLKEDIKENFLHQYNRTLNKLFKNCSTVSLTFPFKTILDEINKKDNFQISEQKLKEKLFLLSIQEKNPIICSNNNYIFEKKLYK